MRQLADDPTVQKSYMQAIEIVENVGIRFESEEARNILQKGGAKVEGDTVYISNHLLEEALKSTPKQDYSLPVQKRVVASTPFSNAPFILDDQTGAIRRCNLEDALKLYQINETSSLYQCANPGCADPAGNDAPDQFVSQIAMTLKYSNKYPSFGLRASGSTAQGGDVYSSARRAFRLVREFYDKWDQPVMSQGICPNPPLAYDRECLDNLRAAIDEQQAVSIIPCTLGYMTGPESIMGIAVHDFALILAGLVFVQLKSPGHPISFCNCSTISNIQTMQPNYGSVECVFIQVVFYELCKILKLPCTISGGYGDGTAVDYQAGMESILTAALPFSLTEVNEVWCSPGLLAGFACGSFHKAVLDEEMIRNANRILQGLDLGLEPKLPELIAAGRKAGSFLGLGSLKTYRRDNYMTQIYNKWGISSADKDEKADLAYKAEQILKNRIAAYQPPERTMAQFKLLEPHLPSPCKGLDKK